MLKIKFLGTRGFVEETSPSHRKYTGLLLSDEEKGESVLLDCGDESFLKNEPKVIFLTHAHPDHIGGLKNKPDASVFMHSFSKRVKDIDLPQFIKFSERPILVDIGAVKLRVTAFPVTHSIRAPAVSFLIEAIAKDKTQRYFFAPDFVSFVKDKPSGSLDAAFVDGSSFLRPIIRTRGKDRYGHAATVSIIREFLRLFDGVQQFFVIHRGSKSILTPNLEERKLKVAVGETTPVYFPGDSSEKILAEFVDDKVFLRDLLESMKGFPSEVTLYKDYLSLVGSLPVSGAGHDIDILVCGEELRAALFRFLHLLPPRLADQAHVFHDVGPFTSYIPLADLVLRFRKPQLVSMSAESSSRFRQGEISRKKDEVVPFRFFFMQKTRSGYHKREVFTPEEAQEMMNVAPFPWRVDQKCDGMHVQVHKVGNRVEIYSEEGNALNPRQFPELQKKLQSIPADFVACAELEAWLPEAIARRYEIPAHAARERGYLHMGRAEVTGYIHSKKYDPTVAKNLLLNIYDVLWVKTADSLQLDFSQLAVPLISFPVQHKVDSVTKDVFRVLGLRRHRSVTVTKPFRMKIDSGDRVMIIGKSGSGKSSILRVLQKELNAKNLLGSEIPNNKPIFSLLKGDIKERMQLLSRFGLADAFTLAQPFEKLSDGQKYRFRLLYGLLTSKSEFLVIDNFAENLDAVTAKVTAYRLGEILRQEKRGLIVATTREDLVKEFGPKILVEVTFGQKPAVRVLDSPPQKPNLKITYRDGKLGEFLEALGQYHYQGEGVPFPQDVIIAECDGEIVGGLVTTAALTNRIKNYPKLKTIARVVVHPIYRGLGISSRLFEIVRDKVRKSSYDGLIILAEMAEFIPFLPKWMKVDEKEVKDPVRNLFEECGFEKGLTIDEFEKKWNALPEKTKEQILAKRRHKNESPYAIYSRAFRGTIIRGVWMKKEKDYKRLGFSEADFVISGDIHSQSLEERTKVLTKIFPPAEPGKLVGHVWFKVIQKPEELLPIWREAEKRRWEGLMLKPLTGPKSKYVLWERGGYWVKLKRLYEMTCVVLDEERSKTAEGKPLNVWRYFCGIKGPRNTVIPVGWTYATKARFKRGDHIEVRFQNLNEYTDPETGKVYFQWWRPCCPAGTKIITKEGLMPIERIKEGDEVLSLSGKFSKVIAIRSRVETKELIRIRASCNPAFSVTSNHVIPVLVKGKQKKLKLVIKEAREIQIGDFLIIPRPQINSSCEFPSLKIGGTGTRTGSKYRLSMKIRGEPEDFYIFGLWLAEGWINSNKGKAVGIAFAFGPDEKDLVEAVKNWAESYGLHASVHCRSTDGRSGFQVSIGSKYLANWFKKIFSHHAIDKRIPFEWLGLESESLRALITGVFDGDGYYGKNEVRLSVSSYHIVSFLRLALLKLGFSSQLTVRKRWRASRAKTKLFVESQEVALSLPVKDWNSLRKGGRQRTSRNYRSYLDDNIMAVAVHSISAMPFRGKVYDIETEDGTFLLASGIAVHNSVVSKNPETKAVDDYRLAHRLVRASKGEVKAKRAPVEFRPYLREEQKLSLDAVELIHINKEPPMPKEAREAIERCKRLTASELKSQLDRKKISLPSHFGVFQLHFRGKSVHIDFRFLTDGDSWKGWTLLNQVQGVPDEPVTTLEAARAYRDALFEKGKSVSKVYPDMPPSEGFMVAPKFEGESDQLDWLCFVAEIVEFPHAGATKEFPGVFLGLDWGYVVQTIDKPWFKEFWVFFRKFEGRLVFRELRTQPGFKKAGKLVTFWRGLFSDPESPPYIFSKRFLEGSEFVPTTPALPPHWEALIPEEFHWWKEGLSRKERLKRIKQSFNYLVDQGYLRGRKISLSASQFVIQRISWKGPTQIRGERIGQWVLRFKHKDKVLSFWSRQNFLHSFERGASAVRVRTTIPPKGKKPEDWFNFEGEIPPSHPVNPNKELPAVCTILEKGSISVEETSAGSFRFRLAGKFLKGYFSLIKEKGTNFYLWRKEYE